MSKPITKGVHHIGLTVSRLEKSASFFVDILGWNEVRRREDYPAIFVSDGTTMVTLWQNKTEPAVLFDRKQNIGLHHVAFIVTSEAALTSTYERMLEKNIIIEFEPELLGEGPAKHMMCYEPSGIRVEIIWPGNS